MLNVLSAPLNQPTLNPKVQPVQQPAFSGRVTQPPQPSFLGAKPLQQQPQIQVDNSPRFAKLGQAVKKKFPGAYDDLEDGMVGKLTAEKYPGVYDEFIEPATTPEEPQGESGLKGFGLGIAKGALSTASNITSLASKVPTALGTVLPPVAALGALNKKLAPHKENFKPQGTAEKIGFGTEQVAEFLLPGGAASKGAKAIQTATTTLPKAARIATNLGTRAVLEGTTAAGVTALQGADASQVKTAGVLGGAFNVAARPIEKLLQGLPKTAWSSILKRTPTEAAKNPNLPAQAARTGLIGTSRSSLLKQSQNTIQQIEVGLDDLLTGSKAKIGTLKIAPYLDELRSTYKSIPGEQASVDAIDNVMKDLLKKKSLTPVEANQLKRDIYQNIERSYGKGLLESPVKTQTQKTIAAGLKREIEKVIPEAKTLNEKQAIYIQVKKALKKNMERTEGKGIAGTGIGLTDLGVGGIGTGVGFATGNPLLGVGLFAAKKTAESPAFLSGTAKLLNYFNQLSPTKKILFYEALKGMTVKTGTAINP